MSDQPETPTPAELARSFMSEFANVDRVSFNFINALGCYDTSNYSGNTARAALDAMLAKAREDALREAASGPDWEGFGRDLLEHWPVRDVDGAELFDAALRNGLIREIPGGYDPEQHIDAECIAPEKGDPWYEYTFQEKQK